MPSTTKKFSWKNRETAALDLLQLVYYAPLFVSVRALDLIGIIGSSAALIPELEAIVLDENRHISERRYSVRAIGAVQGDFYLPSLAKFAVLTWTGTDNDLDFYDVARLSLHHPSNHDWLFQESEHKDAQTYFRALKVAALHYDLDGRLNPLLVKCFIDFFESNPALLDLHSMNLLYRHGGSNAKRWLMDKLDTIIYLCLMEKVSEYFELLEAWPELKLALLQNCPAVEPEYEERRQRHEAHQQFEIERATYLQSETWQKLYDSYLQAKVDETALHDLYFEAIYSVHVPVRAACAFFLGLLQERQPQATDILCYLLKRLDHWSAQGSQAPVRKEAILALRNTPTPQVWEALVDGYFFNPLEWLDWQYFLTLRHVTEALEIGHTNMVAIGDSETIIPYRRMNALWLHDLPKISIRRFGHM